MDLQLAYRQRTLTVTDIVDGYLGNIRCLSRAQKEQFAAQLLNDVESPLSNLLVNAQSRDFSRELVNNSKKPVLTSHIALSITEQAKLRKLFPEYELNLTTDGSSSNHAIAAAARALETDILSWKAGSSKKILDMGGNYMDHITRNHVNVHSCCYLGDNRDLARYIERETKISEFNLEVDESIGKLESKVNEVNIVDVENTLKRNNISAVTRAMLEKKRDRYNREFKILRLLQQKRENFRAFDCDVLPNRLKDRERFGRAFRCFNDAEKCSYPADVAISVEAAYDVTFEKMVKIMQSHGVGTMYGIMIHSRQMLQSCYGTIDNLNLNYYIDYDSDTITFTFIGDSSYQYRHSWSHYKAYLFDNDRIVVNGRRYVYSVLKDRNGIIEYQFTEVYHSYPFERDSAYIDHRNGPIVAIKTFVRDRNVSYHYARQFVQQIAYCPKDVFDDLVRFSMRNALDRGKLHAQAMIVKSYFIINGRSIYATDRVNPDYFEAIVTAILLKSFEMKYLSGGYMTIMIDDIERERSDHYSGMFSSIMSVFGNWLMPDIRHDYSVDHYDDDDVFRKYVDVLMKDHAKFVEFQSVTSVVEYQLDTFFTDVKSWYIGDMVITKRNVVDKHCDLSENSCGDNLLLDDELIEEMAMFFNESHNVVTFDENVGTDDNSDNTVVVTTSDTQRNIALIDRTQVRDTRVLIGKKFVDVSVDNSLDSYIPVLNYSKDVDQHIERAERKDLVSIRHTDLAVPTTIDNSKITDEQQRHEIMYSIDEAMRYNRYLGTLIVYNARSYVDKQNGRPDIEECRRNAYEGSNFNWLRVDNGRIVETLLPTTELYSAAYDPIKKKIVYLYRNSGGFVDSDVRATITDYRVETTSKWLFVYDAMLIYNGLKKAESLGRIKSRFLGKSFNIPYFVLSEGVPGCGKTYTIVRSYKPGDLLLCASRSGADEVRRQLVKMKILTPMAAEKYVRTIDSYLLNPNVSAQSMFVDEALMIHTGDLMACACYSGSKLVTMSGDRKQIPFINLDASFHNVYAAISRFDKIICQLVTIRCPVDITMAVSRRYYYGMMRSCSNVINSVDCVRITSVKNVPKRDGVMYLSFTHNDKRKLIYDRGIPESQCLTIHESQSRTFDTVYVFRDVKQTMRLFDKPGHVIVGLTRHRYKMVYYTCKPNDTMGAIIQEAKDNVHLYSDFTLAQGDIAAHNKKFSDAYIAAVEGEVKNVNY